MRGIVQIIRGEMAEVRPNPRSTVGGRMKEVKGKAEEGKVQYVEGEVTQGVLSFDDKEDTT